MGVTAALKLRQVAKNLETVLALELFCAAQGIDFRRRKMGAETKLGRGTAPVYESIRREVPFIENDNYMKIHLDHATKVVHEFVMAG
jgi:histidine ammonia-lyase